MERNKRRMRCSSESARGIRGGTRAFLVLLVIVMFLTGIPGPAYAADPASEPAYGETGESAGVPSEGELGDGADDSSGTSEPGAPAWADGDYPWSDDDFVWDDDDSTEEPEEEYPEIEESVTAPLDVVQGGPIADIFNPDRKRKSTGGKWILKKGKKYYRYPGGKQASGLSKIDGGYYLFNRKGELVRPKKRTRKKLGGKTYYVAPSGRTMAGWHVIGGKLYYADEKGIIRENTRIDGITLKKGGAAKSSARAKAQKIIARAVDRITTANMTREEKLRACWDYLVSRKHFRYRHLSDPKLSQKTWPQKYAARMLQTKRGDCNSYACAFAAMANDLGYDAWLVYGLIARTRGEEAERYRQHSWVMIRGKNFDPEADSAGWYKNCYGDESYRIAYREVWRIRYATGKKRKG